MLLFVGLDPTCCDSAASSSTFNSQYASGPAGTRAALTTPEGYGGATDLQASAVHQNRRAGRHRRPQLLPNFKIRSAATGTGQLGLPVLASQGRSHGRGAASAVTERRHPTAVDSSPCKVRQPLKARGSAFVCLRVWGVLACAAIAVEKPLPGQVVVSQGMPSSLCVRRERARRLCAVCAHLASSWQWLVVQPGQVHTSQQQGGGIQPGGHTTPTHTHTHRPAGLLPPTLLSSDVEASLAPYSSSTNRLPSLLPAVCTVA